MGLIKFTQTQLDNIITAINNRAKKATTLEGYGITDGAKSVNPVLTGVKEVKVAIADSDINLSSGNLFTKTIAAATTLSVSNAAASGNTNSFILELTNGGSAAITWFSGVKWSGGTAPTLTASGVDILGFYSHDGGTTWRGMVLSKDSK